MRELRCAGRREDTQQGTLATGVARDCGDVESVAGWPSGRERNGLQPGQGATELGFPRPAPGEMQSEAARRAGDPSHQSEDPPPEGLGDHGPLAQTNPRRPAGQVMRHHLARQPGAVGSRPVKWCKSASSCCCCLGGCRLREIGPRKIFVEGQNGGCEVSTSDDPFVVLLSQDGANEAAHGRPVRGRCPPHRCGAGSPC